VDEINQGQTQGVCLAGASTAAAPLGSAAAAVLLLVVVVHGLAAPAACSHAFQQCNISNLVKKPN